MRLRQEVLLRPRRDRRRVTLTSATFFMYGILHALRFHPPAAAAQPSLPAQAVMVRGGQLGPLRSFPMLLSLLVCVAFCQLFSNMKRVGPH